MQRSPRYAERAGAGMPVLSHLYRAFHRPTGYLDAFLDSEREPGWIAAWTPRHAPIRAAQDADLSVLLQVALGLAALLLVVALVNLVTLLLVRGASRRSALAVHAAVGATPSRMAIRLLREGAVLAAAGFVVAITIAAVAGPGLEAAWPGAPTFEGVRAPGAVPALVAGGFLAALLASWLAPLPGVLGRNLRRHLAGSGRATAGPGEVWLRNGLVIAQLGALLVLLTGAALLVLTALPANGRTADPGFDPRDTLTLHVRLPAGDPAARAASYRGALERISRIPGVREASFATAGAWVGLGPSDKVWSRCTDCSEGLMFKPSSWASPAFHAVTPGAFAALGTPVVAGREFTAADTGRVVILSAPLAAKLFPRGTPVGQDVQIGGDGILRPGGAWYTVVGVVRPVRARGIGVGSGPGLGLYLPALRNPPPQMGLAVRADGDPMRVMPAVAREVEAAGGHITSPMTMDRLLARFAAPIRWFALLFLGLSAGAVVLAWAGLHGVMSDNVARRTREIGVRMAVGASTGRIARMVVGQSLRTVAAGTIVGLFGAMPLARGLQTLVHGVRPFDPALFVGISSALALIALAAALRPAQRAARLDPHAALREE